jgi:NAD(P)H-hydrate epimerase
MSLVLTRTQVRDVDRRAIEEYSMNGLVLMENAGRGCVEVINALGRAAPYVILCGKGNNGGDGFVVARHLENQGDSVQVLVFCDRSELQGDALANYEILTRTGADIFHYPGPTLDDEARRSIALRLASCELIIDALLGTGFAGAPREPLATAIRLFNESPAEKMAIDIPSGLDCDTGAAATPTIVADHTCTFVALKPGLLTPSGAQHCGKVHVVDIGVPRKLLSEIVAAGNAS